MSDRDADLSSHTEHAAASLCGPEEPIAIVGMSCRFPGARNLDEFWQLLVSGQDATSEAPPGRFPGQSSYAALPAAPGKSATSRGGFLEDADVDGLDTLFFGISRREAERMDPQQRLLLAQSYHAVEDAGINVDTLLGSRTGVYIGVCYNEYSDLAVQDPVEFDLYKVIGTSRGVLAGRLSYSLGLCGPSLSVDTACSSSLVALHLACQSLRRRECGLAICGGVNLILHPVITIGFSQANMIAPDGRCKSFSAAANGFVRSDGIGTVVLKPLADAQRDGDRIYALILGSAVNSDGRTNGLLITPSQSGQMDLLRSAYRAAGVVPSSVSYVEAHGTGTPVGDPVEAGAIGAVLGQGRAEASPCRIGSVKSNIGHTEAAAGIAGIIKTALCLYHRRLVPSLHCEKPNPAIQWERLGLLVQRELEPWPSTGSASRLAGVSAFGIGGTNAHAVLSEATAAKTAAPRRGAPYLLPLSAMDKNALRTLAERYREQLFRCADDELGALCYSAARRRAHYTERLAVVGTTPQELATRLEAFLTEPQTPLVLRGCAGSERPQVAFLFSGQGSQWVGMARSLLEHESVFREAIGACDLALKRHGFSDLLPTLRSDAPDVLEQINFVQPVLFAIQVALAALWRSLGVEPDVVVGHSMGEVAAACVAQALSLEDAALVICTRSRLMRSQRGQGAMATVELSLEQTQSILQDFVGLLSVAVSSSPTSTVVSGDRAAMDELLLRLEARGVFCRLIKVDVASHSPQMDALLPSLHEALAGLAPRPVQIPMLSTVLVRQLKGTELDAAYWAANLRQPVQMAAAVAQLATTGVRCFIELSPHPLLISAVHQCLAAAGRVGLVLPSLRREKPEMEELLGSLAALYCQGLPGILDRLYPDALPYVPLPRYPFQSEHISRVVTHSHSSPRAAARADDHALLGTPVSLAPLPELRLWQLHAEHSLLDSFADHKVLGEIVMPGAAIADLALVAAAEALGCVPSSLAQLEFKKALTLPVGRSPRLQIAVTRSARADSRIASFQLYSSDDSSADWTLHASAEVSDAAVASADAIDLAALQRRFDAEHSASGESGDVHYAAMGRVGITYGPGYRGIKQLWRKKGAVLARLNQLPAPDAHRISPGLLDSCLQLMVAAVAYGGGTSGPFLPLGIKQLSMFASPSVGCWAYAALHDALPDAPSDHVGDIWLLAETGQVLVALRGVHIRQLASQKAESVLRYFAPQWRLIPAPPAASHPPPGGRWLVLSDAGTVGAELAAILRQRGVACTQVITATAGSGEFSAGADDSYTIDLTQPTSITRLLSTIQADGKPLRGVVHLHSLDLPIEQTCLDFAAPQDLTPCRSALQLIQSLVTAEQWRAQDSLPLILVTRGAQSTHAEESAEPLQALLWGIGAAVVHEHPGLAVRRIDLGLASWAHAAFQLAQEILAPDAETEVALRGETRLGMRLLPLSPPRTEPVQLRPDAAYLITGGLGGLGLITARWLVERGARHLLLLGRNAPSAEVQQILQELLDQGVQVRTVQADIADETDLRRALAVLQEGSYPLRGVIHSAAILADSTLVNLTEEQLKSVLSAKAVGALNLHRLTAELPLDFFILYSSVTAVLGGPGQASYAAANALLDALAQYRRARGLKGLSINWGAWAQVGLAARHNVLDRLAARGVLAMEPADAIASLGMWMFSGCRQVAVCDLDIGRWLTAVPGASRARLWSELRPQPTDVIESETRQARAQILRAPTAERRAVAESVIRQSLAMVLKIGAARLREIAPEMPLVRIGLDSLMAVELRNLLEASVGVTPPLALILNTATSILRLTDHLLSELPASESEEREEEWIEGSL